MLLDETAFFEAAYEQYRSQEAWRQKQQLIDETLYSRHDLHVPDGVLKTGRAQPMYSFLAYEAMTMFKNLLNERGGPLVLVSSYGVTNRALADRDIVQSWCMGVLQRLEEDKTDGLRNLVHMDLGLRGFTLVRVLPNNAWREMPVIDTMREDESLEAYKERIRDAAEAQTVFRHTVFPIDIEWVPAQNAVVIDSRGRLKEVWEFRQTPVLDLINDPMWFDEHGETRFRSLKRFAEENAPLTSQDTVTVISRADDEHFQIGIGAFPLDSPSERLDRRVADAGTFQEIIWEGPHGMGETPYAFFPGRVTNSTDPVLRYSGFLDPVVQAIQRYDELLTQLYSMCRIAAWPAMIEIVESGGVGLSDDQAAIELEEGGITILPAGHRLTNPQWTNAQDMQHVLRAIQILRREISLKTFPEAAFGALDTASGYQQALVQNAAESGMSEFETGAMKGWAAVLRLAIKAARALMAQGSGPIPVKLVNDDGAEYVTLEERQAFKDWDIQVKVRLRPVGGEAALMNTLANEINAGLLSRQTAMERLGIRNTSRELKRILLEQVYNGPRVTQQLQELFLQRAMLLVSQQTAPLPREPIIDSGLAAITQSPELRAMLSRTPAGMDGQPPVPVPGLDTSPVAGVPNPHMPPLPATPPSPGTGIARGQRPRGGGPPSGNPAGAGGTGSYQRGAETGRIEP